VRKSVNNNKLPRFVKTARKTRKERVLDVPDDHVVVGSIESGWVGDCGALLDGPVEGLAGGNESGRSEGGGGEGSCPHLVAEERRVMRVA
jgi:hypothetical protein